MSRAPTLVWQFASSSYILTEINDIAFADGNAIGKIENV
jgi:hypothetical protein